MAYIWKVDCEDFWTNRAHPMITILEKADSFIKEWEQILQLEDEENQ